MPSSPACVVPLRLESERLLLRQFVQDDWRSLHQHYADAQCTQYTFGKPLSEGGTWRAMASMLGHWTLRGYGPYALQDKSSGVVLGTVGLWFPLEWPEPEIKWALSRAYWGQGFASEAVRCVQRMAWQHLPQWRLISLIHGDNEPSRRLALAVGCVHERALEFHGAQWHIYRHPGQTDAPPCTELAVSPPQPLARRSPGTDAAGFQ